MASFYESQAARFIDIRKDDSDNLFCTIPSERDMDIRYRLECVESSAGVEVLSCGCPSRKPCKHLEICRAFWDQIYKPSNVKNEAKLMDMPLNGARAFKLVG